jgi:hypothetical protein
MDMNGELRVFPQLNSLMDRTSNGPKISNHAAWRAVG